MDLLNMSQKEVNALLKGERPYPQNKEELIEVLEELRPFWLKGDEVIAAAETGFSESIVMLLFTKMKL